jgi:hypothetical protein
MVPSDIHLYDVVDINKRTVTTTMYNRLSLEIPIILGVI